MKSYVIQVADDVAAEIEAKAAQEGRSPENYLWNQFDLFFYGLLSRIGPPTEGDENISLPRQRPRSISAARRERIFSRDLGICQICRGAIPFISKWHVDHIVLVSKGGDDTDENLRLTCAACNTQRRRKGSDDAPK